MSVPPGYKEGEGIGLTFARDLANEGQKLSYILTVLGWMAISMAAVLGVASTVVGAEHFPENANFLQILIAHKGLICGAMSIILMALGWQCIDRASAATKTASIATEAIATATSTEQLLKGTGDRQAYEECIHAKSAWLSGRLRTSRLDSMVMALKNGTQEVRPDLKGSVHDTYPPNISS